MNYRTLGRTGVKLSPLVLGGDNFLNPTPEAESIAIIDAALDAGINLIDTSNSYAGGASEALIGRALRANGKRLQTLIATKVHYPIGDGPNERGNTRLHILRACEESLRRLGTEYIDLYQTHRPAFDVPLDETLRAFDDLITQGKVRYIGSSTAPAWHVMEALMTSELKGYARFVSEQSPYNLLDRRIENELLPLCQRHGLAVIGWSPLAMGLLAGRYADAAKPAADSRAARRGGIYAERITPRAVEVGNRFVELARARGMAPAQLAILWAMSQPGLTAPIIGPRTLAQLQSLLPVLDMELNEETRAACDGLVPPGSAVANFFNSSGWMKQQV